MAPTPQDDGVVVARFYFVAAGFADADAAGLVAPAGFGFFAPASDLLPTSAEPALVDEAPASELSPICSRALRSALSDSYFSCSSRSQRSTCPSYDSSMPTRSRRPLE